MLRMHLAQELFNIQLTTLAGVKLTNAFLDIRSERIELVQIVDQLPGNPILIGLG